MAEGVVGYLSFIFLLERVDITVGVDVERVFFHAVFAIVDFPSPPISSLRDGFTGVSIEHCIVLHIVEAAALVNLLRVVDHLEGEGVADLVLLAPIIVNTFTH